MCIGLQGSLGITNPGNTNATVNQMLVNHPWLHITFTKQVLQPTLGTIRESRVLDAIRELTGLDVASIFFWCFKIQGQDWMFLACMCLYAGPLIHWLYSCELSQLNIGKYFQRPVSALSKSAQTSFWCLFSRQCNVAPMNTLHSPYLRITSNLQELK